MSDVKPVPDNSSAVMPMLVCRDVAAEIDFCKDALGAVELQNETECSAPSRVGTIMRSLFIFFALTYIVSWIFFIAAATVSGGTTSPPSGLAVLSGPFLLLGTITPSLVAIALTAYAEGRAGTRDLIRRIVQWPAGARWYVFAASYMAAIKLTVVLLHRLAIGEWPQFGHQAWFIMVAAIVISTPVQAGEEIGWRGYALPRLAGRLGFARASLALGVIWACWHLPFFFIPGVDKSGQSFPVYLLQVTAISVAMAWLYWRTNGSLFLMMFMHAAINNTKDIAASAMPAGANPFAISSSLVAWITVALLWVCAAYFLIKMRAAKLQSGSQSATGARVEAQPESV